MLQPNKINPDNLPPNYGFNVEQDKAKNTALHIQLHSKEDELFYEWTLKIDETDPNSASFHIPCQFDEKGNPIPMEAGQWKQQAEFYIEQLKKTEEIFRNEGMDFDLRELSTFQFQGEGDNLQFQVLHHNAAINKDQKKAFETHALSLPVEQDLKTRIQTVETAWQLPIKVNTPKIEPAFIHLTSELTRDSLHTTKYTFEDSRHKHNISHHPYSHTQSAYLSYDQTKTNEFYDKANKHYNEVLYPPHKSKKEDLIIYHSNIKSFLDHLKFKNYYNPSNYDHEKDTLTSKTKTPQLSNEKDTVGRTQEDWYKNILTRDQTEDKQMNFQTNLIYHVNNSKPKDSTTAYVRVAHTDRSKEGNSPFIYSKDGSDARFLRNLMYLKTEQDSGNVYQIHPKRWNEPPGCLKKLAKKILQQDTDVKFVSKMTGDLNSANPKDMLKVEQFSKHPVSYIDQDKHLDQNDLLMKSAKTQDDLETLFIEQYKSYRTVMLLDETNTEIKQHQFVEQICSPALMDSILHNGSQAESEHPTISTGAEKAFQKDIMALYQSLVIRGLAARSALNKGDTFELEICDHDCKMLLESMGLTGEKFEKALNTLKEVFKTVHVMAEEFLKNNQRTNAHELLTILHTQDPIEFAFSTMKCNK